MGNLITIKAPTVTSSYDYWKIYRSTTQSGTFSAILSGNGQAISDLTYYDQDGLSTSWYKTSYYNSSGSVESTKSAAFNLAPPDQVLSEVYTTVKKVQGLLILPTLTDSTSPTVQQVVEIISRTQDKIDHLTGHAWRLRRSATSSGTEQSAQYHYFDIEYNYEYQTGRPIFLPHRKIKELDTDEGDVLEIWDGSDWVDWISDSDHAEGRGSDFWLDYNQGILLIKARFGVRKPMAGRIKFRYGETSVNGIVEDICTKMVAIEIVQGDFRSNLLPEGDTQLSHSKRIDNWQKDIDNSMPSIKEFPVMSTYHSGSYAY